MQIMLQDLWGQYKAGLTDQHLSRLIGIDLAPSEAVPVGDNNTTTAKEPEKPQSANTLKW